MMIATVIGISNDFVISGSNQVYRNVIISVGNDVFGETIRIEDINESKIKTAVESRIQAVEIEDPYGVVGLKIPLLGADKTVTGKDVFLFLSPYWQAIYDGIPDVHRWRWDKFVTMLGLYRDANIDVSNVELTSSLGGLVALGLIPQGEVNSFLGA